MNNKTFKSTQTIIILVYQLLECKEHSTYIEYSISSPY